MRNSAEMWWNGVIGASDYIGCITQALEKKDSILLFIPQRVPWRDYFMERIKRENPNRNTMSFNLIDCSKCSEESLLNLLLDRFSSMEDYKRSGKTITSYLLRDGVLSNRTIWLYNVPKRLEARWIASICDLQRKKAYDNLENNSILCMEVDATNSKISVDTPYTQNINWDNHIFTYDVLMFAMHRVRNINELESVKTYISQIVSNIAGSDIEFCDMLIRNYYNLIRYPDKTVQKLCNQFYISDDAQIFKMTKLHFTYIIWSAQEQVLFPIIEKLRLDFIKKYLDVVTANYQKPRVKECQAVDLETPYDMELTTLIEICNRKFEGTDKIRNNVQDWNMLKSLRFARNKIAHRSPVEFDLFDKIVNFTF